ncbi:universal stress protein [Nitrosopumilus sp.]|nr:universal stress protein [Nitrosopumilus sp.]MDB4849326.1 universal stress protein [Nitrosopumilus sp.]MDB4857046.1 universal stress protein [Nitrosopumilus sp.]MDC0438047.1 universal stress protein [Nitrosopumilus sp.]MDC1102893.1 universal stress protein [Nitrosopumilus sp.]MDO7727535.1 universal stress protein [Nitrosopumilus sp.]
MPFRKVAVAIITPTHTKKSFELGLEMAKKFDSELTVIECMYKTPPKFYFFETKSDKKLTQSQTTKLKKELENWKGIAQKQGVPIKTKLALTENISHWIIDYVKENNIDLLIVDYPKLSIEEITLFDDIINVIHHKSHCHLLTTKS